MLTKSKGRAGNITQVLLTVCLTLRTNPPSTFFATSKFRLLVVLLCDNVVDQPASEAVRLLRQ